MPNALTSSEIGSEWRTILGHPQLIECMGICNLSMTHGSELMSSGVICILWKISSGIFLQIQPEHVPLDGLCLDFFFFGIFLKKFLMGVYGANHLYFGAQIFPVVWTLWGIVVRQADFDVVIGQCVVSERNLACAVLIRHETLSDGTVKVCLFPKRLCFFPLTYDGAC